MKYVKLVRRCLCDTSDYRRKIQAEVAKSNFLGGDVQSRSVKPILLDLLSRDSNLDIDVNQVKVDSYRIMNDKTFIAIEHSETSLLLVLFNSGYSVYSCVYNRNDEFQYKFRCMQDGVYVSRGYSRKNYYLKEYEIMWRNMASLTASSLYSMTEKALPMFTMY